jgi:hypothetical protein
MERVVQEFKSKYKPYVEICLDLNSFSQALLYKLEINNKNLAEILVASLFSRVLSTYQATLLVAQRGMKQQAKILIRCMLEPLFPLVAISKDPTFADVLVRAEKFERRRAINKWIRYKERSDMHCKDLAAMKFLSDQLKAEIECEGLRKITAFDCAAKAGLDDWYNTVYALTSSTLHASVRSLEEALQLDSERSTILSFVHEPDTQRCEDLLVTIAEGLMHALVAASAVFKIPEPELVDKCRKRCRQLTTQS